MSIRHEKPNLTFVFQATLTVSLVFIYAYQWKTMIASPALRTGTDFISYYAVGRIARERGYSEIYDVALQREYQQREVGFELGEKQTLLYLHVPFTAPLVALVTDGEYTASFMRWTLLMLGIFLVAGALIGRRLFLEWDPKTRRSILTGIILFFPSFYSLLLGQDTAILFLGATLWLAGLFRKNDTLTALGLALTTVRPHICLTLAIPTLFANRRIWWRFVAFAGALALFSVLLIGSDGTLDFINILRIGAGGDWFGMNEADMPNLLGLSMRLCPACDPAPLRTFGWVIYALGFVVASLLWKRDKGNSISSAGPTALIALFTAPHLHYHDLTLLLIPFLVLTLQGIEFIRKFSGLILLFTSFLLVITQSLFYTPYLLSAALAWQLIKGRQLN